MKFARFKDDVYEKLEHEGHMGQQQTRKGHEDVDGWHHME